MTLANMRANARRVVARLRLQSPSGSRREHLSGREAALMIWCRRLSRALGGAGGRECEALRRIVFGDGWRLLQRKPRPLGSGWPGGGRGSPGVQSFLLWWGQSPAGRYFTK